MLTDLTFSKKQTVFLACNTHGKLLASQQNRQQLRKNIFAFFQSQMNTTVYIIIHLFPLRQVTTSFELCFQIMTTNKGQRYCIQQTALNIFKSKHIEESSFQKMR